MTKPEAIDLYNDMAHPRGEYCTLTTTFGVAVSANTGVTSVLDADNTLKCKKVARFLHAMAFALEDLKPND